MGRRISNIKGLQGLGCKPFQFLPRLRKCSQTLPLKENPQCSEDGDISLVDKEENTLLIVDKITSVSATGECGIVKPVCCKNIPVPGFVRHHTGKNDRRPLVPCLDYFIGDRKSTESPTFILSPCAEKQYICKYCNKQFKYFSNLKSHMKIVHKQIVDQSSKDTLISMNHDGQVFQCEVCFRNFKYPSNLRTHRLVHTGSE